MANLDVNQWAGKKIIHEARLDSTNEAAKQGGDAGAAEYQMEQALFAALKQVAALFRGRVF